MNRNTFYLLFGVTGILLVGVLWVSIQLAMPILIQLAFLVAVFIGYLLRRTITETSGDERTNEITHHAAVATLSVFWIVFFLVSIGSVVWEFSRPLGILPPRPADLLPVEEPHFGDLGLVQLGLLGLMIVLYGGFRIYYARKFGNWESAGE